MQISRKKSFFHRSGGNQRNRTQPAWGPALQQRRKYGYVFFDGTVLWYLTQYLEEGLKYPQLYYGGIFFINIIITVCCLLAARWLRNTKLKPPLNLYVPFNLLFVFFTLIVLFWWEDFATVMSISFLSSFFMGTFLIGILIFLFYLYTRLAKDYLKPSIFQSTR
jgi:asparagine N-glycosylation enzyme membrane subunit Stt3